MLSREPYSIASKNIIFYLTKNHKICTKNHLSLCYSPKKPSNKLGEIEINQMLILQSLNSPKRFKRHQFWFTRSGEIAKITSIISMTEQEAKEIGTNFFRVYPLVERIGKGSRPINWTKSGRFYGDNVDDDYDLISRIKNKKQW